MFWDNRISHANLLIWTSLQNSLQKKKDSHTHTHTHTHTLWILRKSPIILEYVPCTFSIQIAHKYLAQENLSSFKDVLKKHQAQIYKMDTMRNKKGMEQRKINITWRILTAKGRHRGDSPTSMFHIGFWGYLDQLLQWNNSGWKEHE